MLTSEEDRGEMQKLPTSSSTTPSPWIGRRGRTEKDDLGAACVLPSALWIIITVMRGQHNICGHIWICSCANEVTKWYQAFVAWSLASSTNVMRFSANSQSCQKLARPFSQQNFRSAGITFDVVVTNINLYGQSQSDTQQGNKTYTVKHTQQGHKTVKL